MKERIKNRMTQLLIIREKIKNIYGKYDAYIVPSFKFILALLTFLTINISIGYMSKLDKLPIAFILALVCSFLPLNFILVIAAVMILLHLYALSLECAFIMAIVFMLMFIMYFRFSPKDTIVVLLTPILFVLKIPYVIPLTMGLIATPASVVSVSCGVIIYYMLAYIRDCANALSGLDASNMISNAKYVIDGLIDSRTMMITLFAFVVTIIAVYFIRRLSGYLPAPATGWHCVLLHR